MAAERAPSIEIEDGPETVAITLSGAVTIHAVTELDQKLAAVPSDADVRLDLGGVSRLDTAGAWLVTCLRTRLEAGNGHLALDGATPEVTAILDTVAQAMPDPKDADTGPAMGVLEAIGRRVAGGGVFVMGLVGYLGLFLSRLLRALTHPREFRLTSLVHHCEEVGVKAVPIVALMAFLIGIVLAFQGASQLRQFGAEVFVVDLIAISILRELGILLTAIIVAGRSASAFTAAIGSMKMREEIDAIRVLGLDPIALLVLPRFLALVIVLPILGFVASLSGLFGGGMMAWIELGITPSQFRTQMLADVSAAQALVGLVKAPVFAAIIALVGCHQGFQVKGDAESLGLRTSRAVVIAIFLVIVMDALFSVFFAVWGI